MFKKLFSKKKTNTTRKVKMLEIDASEMSSLSNCLDNIITRDIDGVLIRNFLSNEEVAQLKKGFDTVQEHELTQYDDGMFIFPKAFSGVDPRVVTTDEEFQSMLLQSKRDWEEFSARFGVDFHSKVTESLSSFSEKRSVELTTGENGEGIYTPQTFRYLEAGKGQFKTHCGVAFQEEFKPFYDRLSQECTIRDQISYFATIQKPKGGGEIILYSLDWTDASQLIKNNSVLVDNSGKEYNLLDENALNSYKVAPNEGDLILFSEGELWHRVSSVEGDVSRITLGGFMTRSKDDKSLKMWS